MNMINYREDESTFLLLLKKLLLNDKDGFSSRLKLATGYLNLQKEFIAEMLKCREPKSQVQILTSSPRANGFYRAGFFKKYIPGLYRVNEEKLLK